MITPRIDIDLGKIEHNAKKLKSLYGSKGIDIIGMSSDHIILDAKQTDQYVGNEVAFDFNYGALLSAMTSPYITKNFKES